MNIHVLMEMADTVAKMSKDPRTKVGAVAVNGDMVTAGYNGFPHGAVEAPEVWSNRDPTSKGLCKYDMVIHAELNAAFKMLRAGLKPTLVVCTHYPCHRCVAHMAQLGVKRIVHRSHEPSDPKTPLVAEACGSLVEHLSSVT
jgi:deoxycytidylate deaminase